MSRMLNTYWDDHIVGELIQDDGGQMSFQYSPTWLDSPQAAKISQSLPLQADVFKRNQCRGFFAGLLPEEDQRNLTASNLGISARNDFAMLEAIGGECAGAITFIPNGEEPPEAAYGYRDLSPDELANMLRKLPHRPLMAGEEGIRLSLAGAQNKLAVRYANGQISVPLGGAPSTHILKPASPHFDGLVYNEAFCMQLAKRVGLPVATVETGQIEDLHYLLVERYDRHVELQDGTEHIRRLHQEDFCQALGITPEHKYQKEGGPTLQNCFDLVRRASTVPAHDLRLLLDAVIFNLLIGNNDAHGKNFSLLYHGSPETGIRTRLAPLYDLICTDYYPEVNKSMAMKLGTESNSALVLPKDIEEFAGNVGLSKPGVKHRVPELANLVLSKLPALQDTEFAAAVGQQIASRCEDILDRFK